MKQTIYGWDNSGILDQYIRAVELTVDKPLETAPDDRRMFEHELDTLVLVHGDTSVLDGHWFASFSAACRALKSDFENEIAALKYCLEKLKGLRKADIPKTQEDGRNGSENDE